MRGELQVNENADVLVDYCALSSDDSSRCGLYKVPSCWRRPAFTYFGRISKLWYMNLDPRSWLQSIIKTSLLYDDTPCTFTG